MRISEQFVASVPKPFILPGNYFRILSATGLTAGSIDVEFWRAGIKLNFDLLDCDPGDYARAPEGFDRIEITSSVNQRIDFHVLRGEAGSQRITGEVSVIEGGRARTLSGVAFMSSGSSGAVAAQFSHVQLFNKVASGKNLIVNKVLGSITGGAVGDSLGMRVSTAAITTLSGNLPACKLLGAAASAVAEIRTQNNAAALGTAHMQASYVDTFPYINFPLVEPIVVPPGFGIIVICGTVNRLVNAQFDHWEEPV